LPRTSSSANSTKDCSHGTNIQIKLRKHLGLTDLPGSVKLLAMDQPTANHPRARHASSRSSNSVQPCRRRNFTASSRLSPRKQPLGPAPRQDATTDALVAELRAVIADLRQDRDHWRAAFENAQWLLPPPNAMGRNCRWREMNWAERGRWFR
jgi:hypothetical protein